MTRAEAASALALGARIADELVDAGADLLIGGDMGIGNTTPAAVLVALLTDSGAAQVVGRGTGIDDLTWMRKTGAVRDAIRRGRAVSDDPIGLLGAVTGPDLAAMTGFLLRAAAARNAGAARRDRVVRLRAAGRAHRSRRQRVVAGGAPQHRAGRRHRPRRARAGAHPRPGPPPR